jgi:Sulfotransferase domain
MSSFEDGEESLFGLPYTLGMLQREGSSPGGPMAIVFFEGKEARMLELNSFVSEASFEPKLMDLKTRMTVFSNRNPIRRFKRQLLSFLFRIPDTGWLGLKPLRTHILICGFRRSGTTLLQMMLEYAHPDARRFGKEVSGWRAATYKWRNHEAVISKAPDDIFRLECLFRYYEHRTACLRPIVLIRDPRDMLTSRHSNTQPGQYAVGMELWRRYRQTAEMWLNSPDVLLLRYEDLVTNTQATQARIDAFAGEPSHRRFVDYLQEARPDFEVLPLNGLRPVDTHSIGRWRLPEHRQRIRTILGDDLGFAQFVIRLGYESSTRWVRQALQTPRHSSSSGIGIRGRSYLAKKAA